jgi:hypothetical protein
MPATVRTHLHRGLARLRATLAERDGGGERWKGRLAAFLALPDLRARRPAPRGLGWGSLAVAGGLGAVAIAVVVSGRPRDGEDEAHDRRPLAAAVTTEAAAPLAARPDRRPTAVPPLVGIRTLRGRVEAPRGASTAGAWVYAVRKVRPRGDASDPAALVRLGDDGAFALSWADPAEHWVIVAPPAGASWRRCVLDGAEVSAATQLRVEADPAVTLRGRVVDVRGDPVTHAAVEVLAVDAGAVRVWPGPGDPVLGAGVPVEVEGGVFTAVLADPLPRRLRVRACSHGDVDVIVSGTSEPVLVVLEPSAVVRIELEGVPSADVVARLERVPDGDAKPLRRADPVRLEGRPVVQDGIAPGSYRLELTGANVRPRRLVVRAPASVPTVFVRAALASGGAVASLRIRGVGLRGAPPTHLTRPGAVVLVRDPEADGGRWRLLVPEVDDDGALRVSGLLDGETPVLAVDREGAIVVAHARLALPPGLTTAIPAARVPSVRVRAPALAGAGEARVVGDGVEWPLYRWDGTAASLYDAGRVPVEGTVLGAYPRGATALRLRARRADGTVVEHELEVEALAAPRRTQVKRTTMVRLGLLCGMLAGAGGQALPAHADEAPKATHALRGLDPVELCGGHEVAGDPARVATHGGHAYAFASEANRAAFTADPERYAIQWGGACARWGPSPGRAPRPLPRARGPDLRLRLRGLPRHSRRASASFFDPTSPRDGLGCRRRGGPRLDREGRRGHGRCAGARRRAHLRRAVRPAGLRPGPRPHDGVVRAIPRRPAPPPPLGRTLARDRGRHRIRRLPPLGRQRRDDAPCRPARASPAFPTPFRHSARAHREDSATVAGPQLAGTRVEVVGTKGERLGSSRGTGRLHSFVARGRPAAPSPRSTTRCPTSGRRCAAARPSPGSAAGVS